MDINVELSTAAEMPGGPRPPGSARLRHMDYLDAVEQACDDLAADSDPVVVQAGLQLAIAAWKALHRTDPGWDLFGLEVLAVAEVLDPQRRVVVVADPPGADGPHLRAAVRRLVNALAARLDLATRDEQRDLADRLNYSAAAAQLRHAVTALP